MTTTETDTDAEVDTELEVEAEPGPLETDHVAPNDHQRHIDEAERLLGDAAELNRSGQIITARDYIAVAQVHATLAVATRDTQQ